MILVNQWQIICWLSGARISLTMF